MSHILEQPQYCATGPVIGAKSAMRVFDDAMFLHNFLWFVFVASMASIPMGVGVRHEQHPIVSFALYEKKLLWRASAVAPAFVSMKGRRQAGSLRYSYTTGSFTPAFRKAFNRKKQL